MPGEDYQENDTEEIPILGGPPNPAKTFRVLEPEEVNDNEMRLIQLIITGVTKGLQIAHEKSRPKMPEGYKERLFIWYMLFLELIPIVSLALILVLFYVAANGGLVTSERVGGTAIALIVLVVIDVWFMLRIYFDWKRTYLFSNEQETGVFRPPIRWLLLGDASQSVETARLQTKIAKRSGILALLHINSWHITLSAPDPEDKFLLDKRFVKHGQRLIDTVIAYQHYLMAMGRDVGV